MKQFRMKHSGIRELFAVLGVGVVCCLVMNTIDQNRHAHATRAAARQLTGARELFEEDVKLNRVHSNSRADKPGTWNDPRALAALLDRPGRPPKAWAKSAGIDPQEANRLGVQGMAAQRIAKFVKEGRDGWTGEVLAFVLSHSLDGVIKQLSSDNTTLQLMAVRVLHTLSTITTNETLLGRATGTRLEGLHPQVIITGHEGCIEGLMWQLFNTTDAAVQATAVATFGNLATHPISRDLIYGARVITDRRYDEEGKLLAIWTYGVVRALEDLLESQSVAVREAAAAALQRLLPAWGGTPIKVGGFVII